MSNNAQPAHLFRTRSFRRRRSLYVTLCAFAVICALCISKAVADCDPKFGDEMLRWVREDAGRQSRALATADFSARTFNSMLLGFDDLHASAKARASELQQIEERSEAFEASISGGDSTSAAIARAANAQLTLDALISERAKTDALREDFQKVGIAPDRASFILAGLYHVGVDTLLESFSQMGDASKNYLPSRYGIQVRVIYDGDGNYKDTQFEFHKSDDYEGAAVTIVYALAQTYPWARYVLYAYAIVKGGQAIDDEEACRRKIERQKDKVHEALLLLPAQLPKTGDLYAIYVGQWNSAANSFASHSQDIQQTLIAIENALRQQIAFQLERISAANQILTAAKMDEVRKDIGEGDQRFRDVVDNVRLARVAAQVAVLRDTFTRHRVDLLIGSSATDRAKRIESARDWARYVQSMSLAMQRSRAMFPIQDLFLNLERQAVDTNREADEAKKRLPRSLANYNNPVPFVESSGGALSKVSLHLQKPDFVSSSVGTRIGAGYDAAGGLMPVINAATGSPQFDICGMVTADGKVYRCSSPGPGASTYRSEFNGETGDGYDDANRGAGDGGYRSDARRITTEISDIEQNIADRTKDIYDRLGRVQRDMPEWLQRNRVATGQIASEAGDAAASVVRDRTKFEAENGKLVEQASAAVQDFLRSKLDDASLAQFVSRTGGADLSLPDVPVADIPDDIVELPGVSAPDRAFSRVADLQDRPVSQERLKATQELVSNRSALEIHERFCASAQRFIRLGGPSGAAFAEQLLEDAASVRYASDGTLPKPTVTERRGDSLVRKAFDINSGVPSTSVLSTEERFAAEQQGFGARATLIRASLTLGSPEYIQRYDGIRIAGILSSRASKAFYTGDVRDGERLLRMGEAVLDVVTRFVPGVNLGRDIYEAVSGKDLFTGTSLDSLGRTAAVLGVVSLGFLDDVKGGFQALRLLVDEGVSLEKAEQIIRASRTLEAGELRLSQHAIEEMEAEALGVISKSEVENTIDAGTHFWDTQERSLVAFENDVAPGEARVAVAVDVDSKVIKTVYRRAVSDKALATETWKDPGLNGVSRGKFILLPRK